MDDILTHQRLREVLDYDPETGLFTWKARPNLTPFNARWAGKVVGYLGAGGYRVINIDARKYRAGRLAWLYMHGVWPRFGIDHRNCIPDDDRIDNLRPANQSENNANSRRRRDNKSGVKGVSWCSATKKWRASIQVAGKSINLGRYARLVEAIAVRRDASIEHFGEFARQ